MSKRTFGELELAILRLFQSNKKMTVKEIHHLLGEEENKYTTIMTVMSRLAEKKLLGREKVGHQYEYWILKDFDTESIWDKLKHKFLGIKTTALVNHLIESAEDLTDEDLAEMEKMVKKIRESKK